MSILSKIESKAKSQANRFKVLETVRLNKKKYKELIKEIVKKGLPIPVMTQYGVVSVVRKKD